MSEASDDTDYTTTNMKAYTQFIGRMLLGEAASAVENSTFCS